MKKKTIIVNMTRHNYFKWNENYMYNVYIVYCLNEFQSVDITRKNTLEFISDLWRCFFFYTFGIWRQKEKKLNTHTQFRANIIISDCGQMRVRSSQFLVFMMMCVPVDRSNLQSSIHQSHSFNLSFIYVLTDVKTPTIVIYKVCCSVNLIISLENEWTWAMSNEQRTNRAHMVTNST